MGNIPKAWSRRALRGSDAVVRPVRSVSSKKTSFPKEPEPEPVVEVAPVVELAPEPEPVVVEEPVVEVLDDAAPVEDSSDDLLSVLEGNIGDLARALATGQYDGHLGELLAAEASGKDRKGAKDRILERQAGLEEE